MIERGNQCRPGDRVALLHEKGEGIVTRVTTQYIYVDLGDGFELPVLPSDIIILEKASQSESPAPADLSLETETPPVSVRVSTSTKQFVRGVYLLLVPDDQQILISGDIQVYLMNYTQFPLYCQVFLTSQSEQVIHYHAHIEQAAATHLFQIDRKEISRHSHGLIQLIFLKKTKEGIPLPLSVFFEIREHWLLNEAKYQYVEQLDLYAQVMQLIRFEEIEWTQLSTSEHGHVVQSSIRKGHIQEKQALIDRYQTQPGVAEVDLHIENITDQPGKLSDEEKLRFQLSHFRQCLDSAIQQEYKRVVFIHGVGSGILKAEIHKVLQQYPDITFRDAPISRYGIGATEIFLSHP